MVMLWGDWHQVGRKMHGEDTPRAIFYNDFLLFFFCTGWVRTQMNFPWL